MPLFVALMVVATLLLILAVRRGAEARRLVRLYHAQEAWAERPAILPAGRASGMRSHANDRRRPPL